MVILGYALRFALGCMLLVCLSVLILRSLTGLILDDAAERALRPVVLMPHSYGPDIRHCLTEDATQPLWDCIRYDN